MTAAAREFVAPLTFQALSGHAVHFQLLDAGQEQAMGHIHLARWADAVVVAPASADLLAKLAHGLADDLLSTLLLAADCPVYVAPAMNQAMWAKPATQRNLATLAADGVRVLGPVSGEQACGELGLGRMLEPAELCDCLLSDDRDRPLRGARLVVSAGPTREALDPVRFISNRSSGKMGYALAAAAARAGAQVTLVSGPVALPTPPGLERIDVETAADMHAAVMARMGAADIYIGAAAVADYRPSEVAAAKLKKGRGASVIALTQNPDIVADVAALKPKPFVVGFAAETDDLENYARGKLIAKNLDMIAANWIGREDGGFDRDRNALQVYWPCGAASLAMTEKSALAEQLITLIAEHFHAKNSTKSS